jgi:hypothetical protein
MNVIDDAILFLGNAQLDCIYTTQSKSRCIRHQTILINGEMWSLNYVSISYVDQMNWIIARPLFLTMGCRHNF